MKDSRIKKALLYQLDYVGLSCLYVYGVAILVACAIGVGFVSFTVQGASVRFNLGPIVFFHFLILGIVGIREDLRFFLQHGIGRRTTYFSHLYCSLVSGIAIGLLSVLFDTIWGYVFSFFRDGLAFSIQGLLAGWLMHFIYFFFAWQLGVLISMIYYRLGKLNKVIFSVAAVVTVVYVLPRVIFSLAGVAGNLRDFIQRIIEIPSILLTYTLLVALLLGILAAAGNYLLIRRAPVKD